jgi:hypothetical protein
MKNIFFIILLLFSFCPYVSFALKDEDEDKKSFARTRFCVQTLGKHKTTPSSLSISGTEDVNAGVSLSIEFFQRFHRFLELGAGAEYQFSRAQKTISGDFNFIPIYAALRIPAGFKSVNPYLIGRIGYNFILGDLYMGTEPGYKDPKGGLYYSFGGGTILFSFWFLQSNNYVFAEVIYSVNRGNGTFQGSQMDVDYSKLEIIFGLENYF